MPDPRVLALLHRSAPAPDGPPDADLLTRFLDHRDQAALEALIRRHAGMVRAVCLAARLSPADADDAFQATFLVFVRRAAAIRDRHAVGGWLYRVAYRVARRLRASTVPNEPLPEALPGRVESPDHAAQLADLRRILHDELSRLPWKYQVVLQLCYLAGRTTSEAAQTLGWSHGTVLTRLAWARRHLRKRLGDRGATLGAGGIGVLLAERGATAVPPDLVRSTMTAAWMVFATGGVPVGVVSERTFSLSEGVVRAMIWNPVKAVVGVLLVATATAVSLGVGALGGRAEVVAQAPPVPARPGTPAPLLPPLPETPIANNTAAPPAIPSPQLTPSVTPSIEPIAVPMVPPRVEPKPPAQAMRLAKTFQVESPVGGWTRETLVTGGNPSKPLQVTLHLEGDRLTLVTTATLQNDTIRTVIEADYSINKESVVFGIVTSVDTQVSESSKAPTNVVAPTIEEDQLFSFRFRVDGDSLTIKDVRFPGAKTPNHAIDELLTGRFATGPNAATAKTEKGMRSLPRRTPAAPIPPASEAPIPSALPSVPVFDAPSPPTPTVPSNRS